MKQISFEQIRIEGGFWAAKQQMLLRTASGIYDRFLETYRFDAMNIRGWLERLSSGKAPDPERPRVGHIFWDSDIAKWIEGTAYLIQIAKDWQLTSEQREELSRLEEICDQTIDTICENADENGYFNSHFQVTEALGEEKRFTDRSQHELYCAGHLIEAAIAYRRATGKSKLYDLMCRYADYIDRIFHQEDVACFVTPGHPELELALVKLAAESGNRSYLELAKFFIDKHGDNSKDVTPYPVFNDLYNQDEMPLRKRSTAEGHCVRAMYLLSGMIDVAKAFGDESLMAACRRMYNNAVNERMYVTGGIGSTHIGEAFSINYHLPNRTAYTETCAAIALAQASGRMIGAVPSSEDTAVSMSLFADTVERTIYNGILSGISLDGKGFFYENPLEIDLKFNHPNASTHDKDYYPETQRREVFSCSCCPPNVLRFYASLGDYLYSADGDTLYIHQYMENSLQTADGLSVNIRTDYPLSGKVHAEIKKAPGCSIRRAAFRLPAWCEKWNVSFDASPESGYFYVTLPEDSGTEERVFTADLEFAMEPRFVEGDPRIHDTLGKVAAARGPVIYAMEGVDQPEMDIFAFRADPDQRPVVGNILETPGGSMLLPSLKIQGTLYAPQTGPGLYHTRTGEGSRPADAVLIPYYAFASRGESDLRVWIPVL